MSETQAIPVAGTPAPVAAPTPVPAKPLTAIQMIEQEIAGFFKQREQAIANVHACDGAIQAAQMLLGKLRAAEQAAVAEFKKAAEAIATDVEKTNGLFAETANKVIAVVEAEAKKL